MNLLDLRIFSTVVRAGGINRAASLMHRAQSGITTRMRLLEQKLGTPLFSREGRHLTLTPQGQLLLEYADRLINLANEASDAIRSNQPSGVLRLGAMESTAATRLAAPLAKYHQQYPDVSIELYSGNPSELLERVLESRLDAALVADPLHDSRLMTKAIFNEELVVVASTSHPPIVSPRDVQTKTLLAFHHGCPHRSRLESWFANAHVIPERIIEASSYHLLLSCVAIGMGIALVPLKVLEIHHERDRLSVHRLKNKYAHAKTYLVWKTNSQAAKVSVLVSILTKSTQVEAKCSTISVTKPHLGSIAQAKLRDLEILQRS